MKTILIAFLLCFGCNSYAQISPVTASNGSVYNGYLVNAPLGLSYSATYTIDLSSYRSSRVSAQVIYSSANTVSSTFTDGSQSTGSITISSYSAIYGQYLTIGGVTLVGGVNFATGTSNSVCATNLAAAIQAAGLGLTSSATGAVVYATSTINGAAYNYSIVSSTPTAMTVSAGPMTGGTTPTVTLGSKFIVATNSFALAQAVLFPKSSNPVIGGLTQGTTYYAVPVGVGLFELVKYASSAFAGSPASDFVTVTSTNTQLSANTYTISPLAWVGSASFVWQASDDGSDWATVLTTGTVGFTSSTAATDSLFDFGSFNFRRLQFKFTAPTSGAAIMQVPVAIKQDGIGTF